MSVNDEMKDPNKTCAIIISDSYDEPFRFLKDKIHPYIWDEILGNGIDLFYTIGKPTTKKQTKRNSFSDNNRYSNLRHLQRFLDEIELCQYNFFIPDWKIESNQITVKIPEGLRYLGIKMRTSFFALHDMGYDLIYKTTSSSLVNPVLFKQAVEKYRDLETPLYAGSKINAGKYSFVSGANLLINRHTVSILKASEKKWRNGFLDDVAIGKILWDIPIKELSSINIASLEQLERIPNRNLRFAMHFRCKSNEFPRIDDQIMKAVRKRIKTDL